MKYIFLLLTLFAAVGFSRASEPSLMIYRNDGKFDKVRMNSGTVITHNVNAGNVGITLTSSVTEEKIQMPASAVDSCIVRGTDIPELFFTFPDYPEVSSLWEKELYLDATLTVEGNNYTDNAEFEALKVKGRGNSTWGMAKKPMRIKFDKKQSLCGLSKAKNFVLLANYIDESHCKNAVALWLADKLGVAYPNHFVPCNVYINGNYRGLYLLTEKIGINGASVDIDESTGVLIELSVEFDEPYKFKSPKYNLPVMIKDPDFDELAEDDPDGPSADERLALWQADFEKAENLVRAKRGFEAFDMEAFVSFYLLNKIAVNNELSHPKSVYIHKEALGDDNKYVFGPAWDYDFAFNRAVSDGSSYWYFAYNGSFRPCKFFQDLANTPGFDEEYKRQFTRFKEEIYPELLEFLDNYSKLIEPSAKLDGLEWDENFMGGWFFRHSTFPSENYVKSFRDWLVKRVETMSKEI